MIEMTLSSRHRIRNSSPGGLRPSTLFSVTEAPRNTDFHTWMGKKHFCFFQPPIHYRRMCHRNEIDICTCIYKMVNLLNNITIYMVRQSYIIKIMLSGIAIINTGYLDYINDYYLTLKLNSIAKI